MDVRRKREVLVGKKFLLQIVSQQTAEYTRRSGEGRVCS